MTKTMVPMFGLILVVAILFVMALGSGLTTITRNQEHASTKHTEAAMVRGLYSNQLCEGIELWFSPPLGTILVLCGIPNSTQWGGLIYRVTENQGQSVLNVDEAYECTVFVESRMYWDRALGQGAYLPLANFPDLSRQLREMWGSAGR